MLIATAVTGRTVMACNLGLNRYPVANVNSPAVRSLIANRNNLAKRFMAGY